MRVARRLVWTLSLLSLFTAAALGEAQTLAIHMISGSKEYKSAESLDLLARHLEENYRVQITASWIRDGVQDLPNIEHIPQADLLIVFARRLKLPEEQMAIVRRHWKHGKPLVGIRTASHAFGREDNRLFDRQVLGGNYQGHFGNDPVEVSVASEHVAGHPVLRGVGEIVSSKLYKAGPLADDAILLQHGIIESQQVTHAVTWLHEYKGGRVFYTSLGVPDDFRNQNFLRMIVNAIFWTTQQDASTLALE